MTVSVIYNFYNCHHSSMHVHVHVHVVIDILITSLKHTYEA
jgi:hypothetical protein